MVTKIGDQSMKIGTETHCDVLKFLLTDPSKKLTFLMTSAHF